MYKKTVDMSYKFMDWSISTTRGSRPEHKELWVTTFLTLPVGQIMLLSVSDEEGVSFFKRLIYDTLLKPSASLWADKSSLNL